MLRVLILLGLLRAFLPMLRAEDRPATDTVTVRAFDAAAIDAYRAEKSLHYDNDLRRLPSLWERFKTWLAEWLEKLFGTIAGGFITRNLVYIISIIAVLFALVILGRGGLRRVFVGAPRSLGEVTTVEGDIRAMDLPAMIQEAEERGDLRRAIRLHYLLVLRKLVDQGVLRWSPELTDRDYMAQIQDPSLRSRFAHIAIIFQWVWYGNAEVEKGQYEPIRRPFIEFETMPVR